MIDRRIRASRLAAALSTSLLPVAHRSGNAKLEFKLEAAGNREQSIRSSVSSGRTTGTREEALKSGTLEFHRNTCDANWHPTRDDHRFAEAILEGAMTCSVFGGVTAREG
jgi:hypothetical protein